MDPKYFVHLLNPFPTHAVIKKFSNNELLVIALVEQNCIRYVIYKVAYKGSKYA